MLLSRPTVAQRERTSRFTTSFFLLFILFREKNKYFLRREETRLSLAFFPSRKLELFMSINRALTNRGNENEQAVKVLRPEIVFFQST